MDRLEIMLKEYETLRQESLDTMTNRSQILSFGLATIGLVIAAVFSLEASAQSPALMALLFGAAIPSVSVLMLYIWLGEVERMMRAGSYLRALETRINAAAGPGDPPLQWEQWLRINSTQMRYPYIVVIGLFFGLTFGSPWVGIAATSMTLHNHWWLIVVPSVLAIPAFIHVYLRARTFA